MIPDRNHDGPLPIRVLIETSKKALGLSTSDLVRRLGYRNIPKGLRRLEQVCTGDLKGRDDLIRALPDALEVDRDVVEVAIRETEERLREVHQQAWRASFFPHAIILTERTIPSPIFVAAVIGIDRILRIDFDLAAGRSSYVKQALNGIRARVIRWNRHADHTMALGHYSLPAYGNVTGFMIHYALQRSVSFGLKGTAREMMPLDVCVNHARLIIGGRRSQH